ncbi:MAG TPA: hypothetical protein VFS08_10315 [Gemmatimonadaceae bacterium]|nr:hypothetical protein [Gemmatimonadaceae bacterium]
MTTRRPAAALAPGSPASAPLARALLQRELRPSRLAAAAGVVAAAAGALGYLLAAGGVLGALSASIERGATPAALPSAALPAGAVMERVVAEQLLRLMALPAALGAAYAVMDRMAADHKQGWLPALVAGGRPALRAVYPPVVVGGVAARTVLLYVVATLAAALGLARGGLPVDAALPRLLPGVAAFVLAAATYGALWGVLLRRHAAVAAALAAAAAPITLVAWWQAARGAPPPHALLAIVSLHLPAIGWAADADVIGQHLRYAALWLALLAAGAPYLVARER